MLSRLAPQLAWLRARLSPQGYLGLQLTLGVVVFVAAAWVFGGIVEDVVSGDPLTLIDIWIASWFHSHSSPWLTAFALLVSRAHDWSATSVLAASLVAYMVWRRHWPWVLIAILAVPGGMLLNLALKLAFQRARPTVSEIAATLHSYSFPSGHVMGAVLLYGLVVAYVAWAGESWRCRVSVALIALVLVMLVAFSRVYLTVHYLSDVLAAAAAGVAWLALCHAAVNTMWRPQVSKWKRKVSR